MYYPLSLKIPCSDPRIVLESNNSKNIKKDVIDFTKDSSNVKGLNFNSFRLSFSLLLSSKLGVPSSLVNQTYNLKCVIEHLGGSGTSGHYVCFKRWKNSWCRISDNKMSILNESDVLRRQAYLLFY